MNIFDTVIPVEFNYFRQGFVSKYPILFVTGEVFKYSGHHTKKIKGM